MKRLIALAIVLGWVSAYAACPEPHGFRSLGSTANTTGARSYTTTSTYLPSPSALWFAMVISDGPCTNFTGNGVASWTQIASTNYNSLATPSQYLKIYKASSATPTLGAGQAQFATARGGCIICVVEVTNTTRLIQTNYNGADSAANPAITMAALNASGKSSVIAFFANNKNVFGGTAEADWTEAYDAGFNSPTTGGYCVYRLLTTDNTVAVTAASSSWAGVAFEIAEQSCPGTVASVVIDTNGYSAIVTFGGGETNHWADLGLGPNNSVSGNAKVALSVTSQGYNDVGTPITVARTVYGICHPRLPYPANAYPDTTNPAGGTINVRVQLSDYIYAGDSNITAAILPGFYMAGPNVATNITVANYSGQPYAKVIGNWTWPNYIRVTNDFTLRATAFHREGMEGRPVRAVVFTAADAHSHSVSVTNTAMTIDRSIPDQVPVQEYVATIPTSTFTDNDILTCNFKAYPWIGDSTSILDSSDGAYGMQQVQYHPLNYFFDKYGTNMWYAVVSTTNSGTGYITNNWNPGGPPVAYATIAAAAAALVSNSREGTIYLRYGVHALTDTDVPTLPKSWTIVAPFPGELRENVVITNATAGDLYCNFGNGTGFGRIMLHNLTIMDGGKAIWYRVTNIWMNQCYLNLTAKTTTCSLQECGLWWATDNVITNLNQGFAQFSANKLVVPLIRGNLWTNGAGPWHPYCVVGNLVSTTNEIVNGLNTALTSLPQYPDLGIVAFNKWMNLATAENTFASLFNAAQNLTNGYAIVGNLIEHVQTNQNPQILTVASDSCTGSTTNMLLWNNSIPGKMNIAYNDKDTTAAYRVLWSIHNNIFADWNIKSDTFTGNPAASGNRVGNWPVLFGTGLYGNYIAEAAGIGAAGSFINEAVGLECHQPPGNGATPPSCATEALNSVGYVLCAVGIDTAVGAGNGNYKLISASPLQPLKTLWALPYDIEGNRRGSFDPPGAYSSASPRKGGGFFGL